MGKFLTFLNTIEESSWSRVIQHVEGDKDFAVVSAFLKEKDEEDNLIKHRELKNELKSLKYGFIEHTSGYTYTDEDDPENKKSGIQHERSLLVPGMDYDTAMRLGVKYGQESILSKTKDNGFVLVYCRDGIDPDGKPYRKGDIGLKFKSTKDKEGKITFDPEVLKIAFSALVRANKSQKGKKYAFVVESICELAGD